MLAPPIFFFFNDTATTEIYTLSLHDALPICRAIVGPGLFRPAIQISRLEIAIDERCLGHGACKQRSSQCQAPCLGSGLLFESTPLGTDSLDRKSTRLNSSHLVISYAVFCLKKKNI